MNQLKDMSDGEVLLSANSVITQDFDQEKELSAYIVTYIHEFCRDVLNDRLISFEKNYHICIWGDWKFKRDKRVDLLVRGEKGLYIIELKNPRYLAENRCAIGQLLNYGREFLDSKKELVLVTTKFDIDTAKTIKYYGLPIRYIYMDREKMLEFKRFDE